MPPPVFGWGAVSLELAPSLHPECDAEPPGPIAIVGIRGQLHHLVCHPSDGTVMAPTGFAQPAWL